MSLNVRRLRRRLWLGRIRKVVLHPISLGIVALLLVGWLGYVRYRPVIQRIPLIDAGGELYVQGRSFGARQGSGHLVLEVGGERMVLRDVTRWSDREVVAQLPSVQSGQAQIVRQILFVRWASKPFPFVVQTEGLPSAPYGYQVPVQARSPWPTFRRDHRNTGRSTIPAHYAGDTPWSFRTGKGIFSTPIIDRDGVIYVGSADHVFYALHPDGGERWRFETGEVSSAFSCSDVVGKRQNLFIV